MNAPVAASRRRTRSDLAQSLRLSSETNELTRALGPRPEAVTLLSEIMARLHGVDMPVVQFIRAYCATIWVRERDDQDEKT